MSRAACLVFLVAFCLAIPSTGTAQGEHTNVTPDNGTASVEVGTGGHVAAFTVENTSGGWESYSLSCARTGRVTSCAPSPSWIQVGPYSSVNVNVTYSVGIPSGSGSITLTALSDIWPLCDDFDPDCAPDEDAGYYSISVTLPQHTVDLTNYHGRRVDYGMCLQACFAATYARSTVPYFSLDAPRSVTLTYNEDRTSLKPIVFADVTHSSSAMSPDSVKFQVAVNGLYVTFVNGEPIMKFSYPGTGTYRYGGQFDASSYGTGAHALTVTVTSYYSSGVVVRSGGGYLVVLDERNAPIARGWGIAGWQRLYPLAGGSVLIAEGDGSYSHFLKSGGTLLRPWGDFSRVTDTGPDSAKYVRVYPDSTRATFNSAGRLTKIVDRFSNTTVFTHDASSRPWKVTDPQGLVTTLNYGANGLASIQDPFGRYTYVTVQTNKTLTRVQDPDGVGTNLGYDASLRLQTITDRRNKTTTLAYDSESGKLASIQAPTVYVYGVGNANPTTWFDPWQKDGVPYGSTATAFPPVVWFGVDATIRAPDSVITTYRKFDRHGQPYSIIFPYATSAGFDYNADGQVTYSTSSFTPAATNTYDTTGFLTHSVLDGIDTWQRKGGWGQADSIWGDLTPQRIFLHSGTGRVDSVRVASDPVRVTNYTYDSRGRLLTTRDPKGHLVRQTWYAGVYGGRSKDSMPGGRRTTYGHDYYGRTTTVGVSGLPTTFTTYDILNRPTSYTDGVNAVPTIFAYDSLYLKRVTDPKNQVYEFVRDALGAVTARIDPAGRADSSQYGWMGELRRFVNRRGNAVAFSYDSLVRRTWRTGDNFTDDGISYSPDGRIITGNSPVSTETVYNNLRGQPDSVKTVFAAIPSRVFWRRYAYDSFARLTSVQGTGSSLPFKLRGLGWSTGGRLSSLNFGGAITGLTYNADGQDTLLTLPGTNHTIARQFTSVHGVTRAWSVAMDEWYHYDVVRRLDQAHDWGDGQQLYGYDGLSRLQSAEFRRLYKGACIYYDDDYGWSCVGGYVLDSTHVFSYDQVGNRLDKGGTYDVGNRITAFDGCTYGYDYDGNVVSRNCPGQSVTFTWNALNQLTGYTVNGNAVSLGYDAFGQLVERGGWPTEEKYIWERGNLYAVLNPAGTTVRSEYSYYPGLDELHGLWVDATVYFAHLDGKGNVVALTDQNRAIQRSYVYDEWGRLIGGNDVGGLLLRKDRARFKGALWYGDSDVELYYMRNRWYEPKSGRFLSEDPLGPLDGLNPYTFAALNPITLADPQGLHSCEKAGGDHIHDPDEYWHYEDGKIVMDSVVINAHAGCAEDGPGAARFAAGVMGAYLLHFGLGYPIHVYGTPGVITFQLGVGGDFYTTGGGLSYSRGWFLDTRGFGQYHRAAIGVGWLYGLGVEGTGGITDGFAYEGAMSNGSLGFGMSGYRGAFAITVSGGPGYPGAAIGVSYTYKRYSVRWR